MVFSGSSLLQIAKQKGDLSRRAIIYNLHSLSLREYINFVHGKGYSAYSLKTLLADHQKLAGDICREIKPLKGLRGGEADEAKQFIAINSGISQTNTAGLPSHLSGFLPRNVP